MNSDETKKFREKVNQSLYTIIDLKDKLERLEKSETNTIKVSLEFDKIRIDNEILIGIPVREFIRHQIIMRLKSKIEREEKALENLKYYTTND